MAGQPPKPPGASKHSSFWDQLLASAGATGGHAGAGAGVHDGDPLSLGLASAAEASAAKAKLPPFQAAEAHQLRYPAQPEPTITAADYGARVRAWGVVQFEAARARERAWEREQLQPQALWEREQLQPQELFKSEAVCARAGEQLQPQATRLKSHPITLARAKNKAMAINATVAGAASADSTSSDEGSGPGSDGKMSSDTPPPEEEEMGQLDTCEVPSELVRFVASAQPTRRAEPSSSTQGQGRRKRARRSNKLEPRSGVWQHFTRLRDGGGNATGQAECKRCRDRLSSRYGTSSLWKHVDVCSAAAQQAAAPVGAGAPPLRLRPGDMAGRRLPGMEEASKHLARMIVSRGYDTSLVEDDCFRTFVAILNPEFRIPSRAAIEEMCDGILKVDGRTSTSSQPQHKPANRMDDVNSNELREWLFR